MKKKMTSIIIPIFNLPALTLKCIQGIRKWTAEPYELILIDNGSEPGLESFLRHDRGLRLIRNRENRGFSRACNQGIRMARGDRYLLLNNDTVITPHWLENLCRSLESDSCTGLVGPLTNGVANPLQRLECKAKTVEEIEAFGLEHNRPHPGRWFQIPFLSGFCLLIAREVIQEVGLLEEGFGLALQEDYDLCLRARRAGFKTICAGDTFVYHYYLNPAEKASLM